MKVTEMFRNMRKKEREIDAAQAKEILERCEYGILSTVGDNGYAYGVPLSYVYIDNAIYFHCAVEGQKLDNLKISDKVSFCVVGQTCILPDKFSTKYESVIVFGRAKEVFGDEKKKALIEIINKYSPDYMDNGLEYIQKADERVKVIKISLEYLTGKARR